MKSGWVDAALRIVRGKQDGKPSVEATEDGYRDWMKQRIARHLKVDPSTIDEDAPFSEYGLDSRTAVRLSGELEKLGGFRVSPALLFEHDTVRKVAQALANGSTSS